MITTKYNFKQWLHKKYPDITATAVYGLPAYMLSKDLDPVDNMLYGVQQLASGRYIVFLGNTNFTAVKEAIQRINEGKPLRPTANIAPTTFASFTQWLLRNNITPINRVFCSHKTPHQLLAPTSDGSEIHNCVNIDEPHTWYMYELPYDEDTTPTNMYSRVPYITTPKTIVLLIKACNSRYISKKQRFMDKFVQMQPLYEQLIKMCATATTKEQLGQDATKEWSNAVTIAVQYMSIQFEYDGTIDVDKLKEAAHENVLGIFIRDRNNFTPYNSSTEF